MRKKLVVEPRFRWEVAWVGIGVLGVIGAMALQLSEEPKKKGGV